MTFVVERDGKGVRVIAAANSRAEAQQVIAERDPAARRTLFVLAVGEWLIL